MSLFVIGDTHLSLSVDKPMDIFRGWTDYIDRIQNNWNKVVSPDDSVVIPGDISWAMNFNEAIKDFYEEPKQPEAPKEEKPIEISDDVDLQIVVGTEDAHTGFTAPAQSIKHEDGDIVIDFDVEEQLINPTNPQPGKSSVFAGWMRGRK